MAFWNRRSVDTGTEDEEIYRPPGRHWPALLLYLLIALIVATGVVFAGRWAYRKATTPENPVPTITNQTETSKTTDKSNSSSKKPTNSSTSSSSSSSDSANNSTGSKSSTAKAPAKQPLPNSGPSETAAIFLGSAFVASSLFYIYSLRRVS